MSRARLLCRSRNPFLPSIALWQHFVLPTQALLQQERRLNSVAATKPSSPTNHVESSASDRPNTSLQSDAQSTGHGVTKPLEIRVGKHSSGYNGTPIWRSILQSTQQSMTKGHDYKGVVFRPKLWNKPSTGVGSESPPWMLPPQERSQDTHKRLTVEIEKFYEYAKPNECEMVAREQLTRQVESIARLKLPGYNTQVFGSQSTGLALARSDIDIRLFKENALPTNSQNPSASPKKKDRKDLLKALHALFSEKIQPHDSFERAVIRHARYPLITFKDEITDLDVQIVLSNDQTLRNQITERYLQEYPYLIQLYSVIKTTFDVRKLTDVYVGGLGSYPLFMMIVASLQQLPHPRKDVAGAFINFFQFWAKFETQKYGISIEPASLFDKSKSLVMPMATKQKIERGVAKPKPSYMLILRDPVEAENNLGRQASAIKHFQSTCAYLAMTLERQLETPESETLLDEFVGPVYWAQQKFRKALNRRGQGLINVTISAETWKNTIEDTYKHVVTPIPGSSDMCDMLINRERVRHFGVSASFLRVNVGNRIYARTRDGRIRGRKDPNQLSRRPLIPDPPIVPT